VAIGYKESFRFFESEASKHIYATELLGWLPEARTYFTNVIE
jgi:hypothetical protein